MSPWAWFLAGWLFAWLPFVLLLGLMLIIDLRTNNEDKYWQRRTEPIRDAWRQEILSTRCTSKHIQLCDFPPEDRKVLQELGQW